MVQCIRCVLVALTAATTATTAVLADEVTMRLRGSEQQFSGTLKSYDGKAYVVETELFGEMTFDTSRFECISAGCAEIANNLTAGTEPASGQPETALSRKRQIELFEGFREWNEFQTFLEWRKNNPNN